MKGMGGWAKILDLNQDGKGWEDRPRSGNTPGWGLTSPYLTTLSSLTFGQGTVR
ncbi:hypothetical protein [Sphingobacterium sp. NPDC055431]